MKFLHFIHLHRRTEHGHLTLDPHHRRDIGWQLVLVLRRREIALSWLQILVLNGSDLGVVESLHALRNLVEAHFNFFLARRWLAQEFLEFLLEQKVVKVRLGIRL